MEECKNSVEDELQQDNSEIALVQQPEPALSDVEETSLAAKIAMIKLAAKDPLFMADLEETMADFAYVDGEWWELSQ